MEHGICGKYFLKYGNAIKKKIKMPYIYINIKTLENFLPVYIIYLNDKYDHFYKGIAQKADSSAQRWL